MSNSRRIIKNMLSLSAAEAANKGIQFIYTAYLGRILLPDGLGVFGWANAFLVYFLLIVNLGFNTLGIREVAKDKNRIGKYVNNIVSVRFMLALISYVTLFFSALLSGKPEADQYVVWIAGFNLFSNAILLDWVYQGIERMEILAIRQVITGILNLIGIFLFVHTKEHTAIAMTVIAISTALNSLWMLMVYIKLYGRVQFELDFPFIKQMMKSSLPIAFSNFFGQVLNNLSIFLLGFLCTNAETGYYTAAFKIYLVALIPSAVIQNAFFPVISRAKTLEDRQRTMKKFTMLQFMSGTFVVAAFFTFSDFLVLEVFKDKYFESIKIFQILMVTGLLVYVNITYTPPLIAWNKEKKVMYALIIGGIVSIAANFILIEYYRAPGAAIATILAEGTVGIGLGILFYKAVKKLYLLSLLKFLIFSAAACYPGYLLVQEGAHTILAGFASLLIYILINFIFKTVTISELKGYLAK